MSRSFKAMPLVPDDNMVNAAYVLVESMPKGTPSRDKALVAAVWQSMVEVAPKHNPLNLTPLQRQVREIIADYIKDNGQSPTYAEIGRQLGRDRSAIHHILYSMKRRGIIDMDPSRRRTIRLLIEP